MKKDITIFLKHILESIAKIEEFTEGISKTGFVASAKTQDAVIWRIEIIGEAIKNLPNDFTEKHSGVQWKEFARMRNKLIHAYFGVDLSITWNVVKKDLPVLKKKIRAILEEELQQKKGKNG